MHVSLSFMKKAYLNRAKVQGEKRGWIDIFYDIGGLSFYKILDVRSIDSKVFMMYYSTIEDGGSS